MIIPELERRTPMAIYKASGDLRTLSRSPTPLTARKSRARAQPRAERTLALASAPDLLEFPCTLRSFQPSMTNPIHQHQFVVRPLLRQLPDQEAQVNLARTFPKHCPLLYPAPDGRIVHRAQRRKISGVADQVNPLVAHRRSHRTVRRR